MSKHDGSLSAAWSNPGATNPVTDSCAGARLDGMPSDSRERSRKHVVYRISASAGNICT